MEENIESLPSITGHFETLISQMSEAVLVENEKREIILANQAFCDMFQIPASPSQLFGTDCSNAAEESKGLFLESEEFTTRVTHILQQQKKVIGDILRLKGGMVLERDYIPVIWEGKYKGHMWKYRDVTEYHNLLDNINQSRAEIVTKNTSLDEFAYIISHDLKAPLRGIKNLTTWLSEDLEGKLNPELSKNMELIIHRVGLMEKLISGVLKYSKIGLEAIEFEEVNINELLEDLIQLGGNEDTEIILPKDPVPKIIAKKVPLFHVFSNFFSNAVNHNNKDKKIIEITYEDTGNFHQFHIRDNGMGIKEEDFPKVFEFFQTLQPKMETQNTGIGLSIVQKIINIHHGKIWVDSEIGKGSTFHFSISKNLS